MGCGCLLLLASGISPRLAVFLMWIFTDRLSIALDSFWIGLAGFLVLPWTTFVYAAAYSPVDGVSGLGVALVVFAFIVDVASWFGTGREGYARQGSGSGYA